MTRKINTDHICPVCGKFYFEIVNAYEDCEVCGWVDDPVQRDDPDYKGGFNFLSVNEAKKEWARGIKNYWKK